MEVRSIKKCKEGDKQENGKLAKMHYKILTQRSKKTQNIKKKPSNTKHAGIPGHKEKNKAKNIRNRRAWRFLPQRIRKCLQQNCRRKLSQPKEIDGHKCTRSL